MGAAMNGPSDSDLWGDVTAPATVAVPPADVAEQARLAALPQVEITGQPQAAPSPAPVAPPNGILPPSSGAPSDADLWGADAQPVSMPQAAPVAPVSLGADMGKSALTGLAQGATGLLGLPGDILDGVDAATQWTRQALGGSPSKDTSHIGARTILPGITLPDTPSLDSGVQAVTGKYYDPQTTAGKFTKTIASFAPAALGGGEGILPKILAPIISGTGSEAAGELTAGTPIEPYARFLGGMGAMVGQAGVSSALRSPQQAIAGALDGVTPAQLASADQIMQNARAQGIALTKPEAIQQATGGATGAGRMQRVVESTRQGGSIMAPFFADRPTQVRTAVGNFADQIAPPTAQPGMIGANAQDAATTTLNRARQTVNTAADPYYQQLRNQTMDPAEYQMLADNPSYTQSLGQIRNHPILSAPISGMPDNNLHVVNEVVKNLDTMGTQAAGTPLSPGNNYLASLHGNARQLASQLASDASDAGGPAGSGPWSQARNTVASLSRQYVDPLKAGPLGPISATPELSTQTGALYPSQPAEGAPFETAGAINSLNTVDPSIAPALTRQHIMNSLNTATRDLQTGANQYGGARLAVQMAGNPEQAATLRSGVGSLPNGAQNSQSLDELLQSLRATGQRERPGSMTAFNEKDLASLGNSPVGSFLKNINIAEPGEGIGKALSAIAYRRNIRSLADWMTSPDGLTQSPTGYAGVNPVLGAIPASAPLRRDLLGAPQ